MAGGERGPEKLFSAEKRQRIIELRRKRWSFPEIAKEMGLSVTTVYNHYNAVCRAIPAPNLEEHRREMLEQLDEAERVVLRILHGRHPRISANGKIVMRGLKPVEDPEIRLKAAKTLVDIQGRKARLLGADAEVKNSKPNVQVTYSANGVSVEDLT